MGYASGAEGKGLVRSEDDLVVNFVRGRVKSVYDNVEPREGTLHEYLISCMVYDLKFKNDLVPSHETTMMINSLQQALAWADVRQRKRERRGVYGTYKK